MSFLFKKKKKIQSFSSYQSFVCLFVCFFKVSHTTVQTLATWQNFFHQVLNLLQSQCGHPLALTWCVSDIWHRTDTVLIVNVHQRGPQSHHSFSFAHSAGVQVCRNNNQKRKNPFTNQIYDKPVSQVPRIMSSSGSNIHLQQGSSPESLSWCSEVWS